MPHRSLPPNRIARRSRSTGNSTAVPAPRARPPHLELPRVHPGQDVLRGVFAPPPPAGKRSNCSSRTASPARLLMLNSSTPTVEPVVSLRFAGGPHECPRPRADCTSDELMVVTLPPCHVERHQGLQRCGFHIPVCGYLLERKTHAPELVWAASSMASTPTRRHSANSTLSDSILGGLNDALQLTVRFLDIRPGWDLQHVRVPWGPDRTATNTAIGSFAEPKVRLPGGGMADLSTMTPRSTSGAPPTTRRYVCRQARLPLRDRTGRRRRPHRANSASPAGPQLAITSLGCHLSSRFPKVCGSSPLHPGVTAQMVQEATGFEVLLPDGDIPTTDLPTDERAADLAPRGGSDVVVVAEFA